MKNKFAFVSLLFSLPGLILSLVSYILLLSQGYYNPLFISIAFLKFVYWWLICIPLSLTGLTLSIINLVGIQRKKTGGGKISVIALILSIIYLALAILPFVSVSHSV